MDVDPNKVIERLANQISQISVQNAALHAQLAMVVDAYNELASGENVQVDEGSQPEVVQPDEVIKSAVSFD